MARQRRNQFTQLSGNDSKSVSDLGTNSSSSNGSNSPKIHRKPRGLLSYWKQCIGFLCFAIAVGAGYIGYLETRVNTPFDLKKVVAKSGLDVPERYWGSYRPGTYFGLKTRDPTSMVVGLMWYFPQRLKPGVDSIRHWCDQGNNLDKYGWIQHDGINFGVQEVLDAPFILTTSFVKRLGGSHGGDWTARIHVNIQPEYAQLVQSDEEVALIWYAAIEENTQGYLRPSNLGGKSCGIKGETAGLGEFTIKLANFSGAIRHDSYLSTIAPGINLLKETLMSSLRLSQDTPTSPKRIVLGGKLFPANLQKAEPNFVAVQLIGRLPFVVDVVFESGSFGTRQSSLLGNAYTDALRAHQVRFAQRFEDTFKLKQLGYATQEIKFAQAALSNMLGGIGYFYGASKVQSVYTKEPVPYWRAPLYTAVPSRSFFPRGFLWDEGFHGLLIAAWDLDIELDIICHWFDLMNVEGWIPREQILGGEALAKVPEEFVTQRNSYANPPTFFLTLDYILRKYEHELTSGMRLTVLERLYPRLQAWFSWFNVTQKGVANGAYRWRGRDPLTNRELNPKTLTSGLDDYPRASHPTDHERHIDLRCWMTLAAQTMARLAHLLGRNAHKYAQTSAHLRDNRQLGALHWSARAHRFADYGLHTDQLKLTRPKALPRTQTAQSLEMVRVVQKQPEYRLVDTTFGYVSLFPFLLQLLDVDAEALNRTLTDMRDPHLLWTPYGLRSLARTAPLYMKRNTEHDPPYWRGQIWININYLAVRALYYYAHAEGPCAAHAHKIYIELRRNLIENVYVQYMKTGYVWEQYNDKTGEGSGCRPFTGWSALVVMMMGELY